MTSQPCSNCWPAAITNAVRDQGHLQAVDTPQTIGDVLYFAILLAANELDWKHGALSLEDEARRAADRARYADLLNEVQDDIVALRAGLSACTCGLPGSHFR